MRKDLARNPMLSFYCNDRLSVRRMGPAKQRLVYGADTSMALVKGALVMIFATDQAGSLLAGKAEASLDISYLPYGFSGHYDGALLLGFAGLVFDSVSTGYLAGNGHRLYNAALRRFTRPDELSPFGEGGLNAYAYCQGDPVNRIDRAGRSPMGLMKSLFGGKTRLTEALRGEKLPKQQFEFIRKLTKEDHKKQVCVLYPSKEGYKSYTFKNLRGEIYMESQEVNILTHHGRFHYSEKREMYVYWKSPSHPLPDDFVAVERGVYDYRWIPELRRPAASTPENVTLNSNVYVSEPTKKREEIRDVSPRSRL